MLVSEIKNQEHWRRTITATLLGRSNIWLIGIDQVNTLSSCFPKAYGQTKLSPEMKWPFGIGALCAAGAFGFNADVSDKLVLQVPVADISLQRCFVNFADW